MRARLYFPNGEWFDVVCRNYGTLELIKRRTQTSEGSRDGSYARID